MPQNNISSRWLIGTILVVIGAFLFLEQVVRFNFNIYFPWWVFSWHTIFIVIGIIILASSSNRTAGLILIIIGGLTLVPHWWPLMIVLLGVYLLTRGNFGRLNSSIHYDTMNNSPDFIEIATVFGGGNKFVDSQNFRGGSVTAIFGGSEINMLSAKLAEGQNVLDVTCIFGGCSIQIPSDWNIRIEATPIFGGISDKRFKDPNFTPDANRVLVIKGVMMFGGIDIKN